MAQKREIEVNIGWPTFARFGITAVATGLAVVFLALIALTLLAPLLQKV